MSSTGVDRITGVDPSVAIKAPCKVATTANITLSGAQTVDGVALTETTPKTRVLVRSQTSSVDNGIYDVYDTAWQRSDDFNGSRDVVDGTLVAVEAGSTYSGSFWRTNATDPISIGTTAITFIRTNNFDSAIMPVATFADLATTAATADQVVETLGHTLPGVDAAKFRARTGSVTTDNKTQINSATAGVYWEKYADNVEQTVTRDINAKSAPAFSISSLQNACMLKKLRTDYPEFCVYTPITPDGLYWSRWLFTNRFNATNDGAPRMINATLAGLYPATVVAKVAENKATGTTATSPTVTKTNADGVQVGTWTAPTTTGGVANINYSTTTGDTKTWTVTGAERYTMESIFLSNGGIANVKVYTDAGLTTEIPEGNYLTPSNRLVQFLGGSNNLQHIPLCKGLTAGSTYYIRTTVDATNPASGRVYQGRIFGYNDIEFNEVGIHGVVDDSSLAGQTNSRSYNPGTTVVYSCLNCTSIKWRYVETTSGSIVTFKVYDSVGVEIPTYVNTSKDTYAPGSTAKEVVVAQGLALGDYYLHVTNGKTRNASNVASPGYRYYDFGAITFDQTTAGTIGVDDFDDLDMPNIVTDPNNDTGNGTQYLLIGTGNLELAIGVRKTTEAIGDEEFVGGIHGFETTPTPAFYGDGTVIDFAGGAQFDTWIAGEIAIEFTTTLKFAVDSTNFCTVDYELLLSQSGYGVKTTKTTLANSYIHNEYNFMMNVPSTDADTQGELTGGGFEKVAADINYIINQYDNSGTFIGPRQEGVAYVNNEFMVMGSYTVEPTLPIEMTIYPYSQGNDWSLIQDRTDRTVKFYTRAFNGDPTNGVLVPSGTSWGESKNYKIAKGNFKNLFGFGK